MNKNTIISLLGLLCFPMIWGCRHDSLSDVSVVEANAVKRQTTDLDAWIKSTLTIPYGIEVVYRWERNSAQYGSYTYPPKPESVRKVLETAKALWIDLYAQEGLGGKAFMVGKAPVKIYLYGGKNVDIYGFEMLSNATATGSEMHLYNVNDFNPEDPTKVYILMRSIHHQFAKRLGEIYPYDRDKFLSISQRRYVSSTGDYLATVQRGSSDRSKTFSLTEYGHKRGFLTLNSMLSAQDDFAEVISATLMHTAKDLRLALQSAKVPYPSSNNPEDIQRAQDEAQQAYQELSQKMDFVTEYFKRTVGLHLGRLQVANLKLMRAYLSKNKTDKSDEE